MNNNDWRAARSNSLAKASIRIRPHRFQIGDTTLPAHRFPLMAHSSFFWEMFTNPMAKEFQIGVVKIPDEEPMRSLIRYFYNGHLDAETMDGQWALETFKLADLLYVDGLKALLYQQAPERGERRGDGRACKSEGGMLAPGCVGLLPAMTFRIPFFLPGLCQVDRSRGEDRLRKCPWRELKRKDQA